MIAITSSFFASDSQAVSHTIDPYLAHLCNSRRSPSIPNHTFAELLGIYFRLHQDPEDRKTQNDLADEIQVSRRTVAGWFNGDYAPRSPEMVHRLAKSLVLTPFQADLLLYSVNPKWIRYGTPVKVLETAEVIRYAEEDVSGNPLVVQATPPRSIGQIESEWRVVFEDAFETNYKRWGVGTKSTNLCRLERVLQDGTYKLTLHNVYHEDVFMGGDSSCFAPGIYYLSVRARMTRGETVDDGYGLIIEEISDDCHATLRIREKAHQASVIQTFNGEEKYTIYVKRIPLPALRPGKFNKLAVLAIHNDHWFYINNLLVCQCVIPRLPYARLDVGIIGGSQQTVTCDFQDFRVYAPRAIPLYPALEELAGSTPAAESVGK